MFSILKKPQNTINADDLEQLQSEIERHLVDNVKQRWKLERLLDSANNVSPETASQPAATVNHEINTTKATISSSQPTTSLPSGKLRHSVRQNHNESELDIVSDGFKGSAYMKNKHGNGPINTPNNHETEAPDKLWPFVEQFCVTPTTEQMKELEDMLKSMNNDKEYYRLPATLKKESPEAPTKTDGASNNHASNNKSQRKSKVKSEEDTSLGALTQRLVSSFIEEVDDNGTEVSKSSSDLSSPPNKRRKSEATKSLDADSAKNLEKRIRQQLEECSILSQQDEIPYTSEEDEILRELLALQHELLSIQNQSKHAIQILLKKAERHAQLEAERKKLMEANADVFAAYHRLIQAKQRRRNPSKKEREAAHKALKVHDAIFKKCDELYITSLDRPNNP